MAASQMGDVLLFDRATCRYIGPNHATDDLAKAPVVSKAWANEHRTASMIEFPAVEKTDYCVALKRRGGRRPVRTGL